MNRIQFVIALVFLTSCGGLQRVNRPPEITQLKNNTCKTLFKKQRHQYSIAVRGAKARQRWKTNALLVETKIDPRRNTMTVSNAASEYRGWSAGPEIPCVVPTLQEESQTRFAFSSRLHPLSAAAENIPAKDQNVVKSIQESKTSSDVLTNFDASILSLVSIGFSGLAGVALLKLFQARAQRLSHRAKKNPLKTRMTLGIAQAGMGMASLWLGNYLYESGVMIPEYARLSAAGIFTVAAIFYPTNYFSNGSPTFSYMQRKFHDAALFTAGAMITVYAGNHYNLILRPTNFVQSDTHITTTERNIISVTFAKRSISVVKKQFEAKLKKYFEDPKGKTRGEKIALIIIASLGFAFLTAAVAAVSCNLSCSGNEAAAILVFLAGGALIAWGLTAALRSIHRSPTIEKRPKVEPLVSDTR